MSRYIGAGAIALVALLMIFHPAHRSGITVDAAASASPRAHRKHRLPSMSTVYVAGAVEHPGLYRVPIGARAVDALKLAGGFRPDADATSMNLAERVEDGQELIAATAGSTAHSRRKKSTSRAPRKHKAPPAQAVDLNASDVQTLASIPGIGRTLAQRIVDFRSLNGPFASLDELADVAGMTQARIDSATPFLVVQ